MSLYYVTWEIHIDAETPEDAAREAFAIVNEKGTEATVFLVQEEDAERRRKNPKYIDVADPISEEVFYGN